MADLLEGQSLLFRSIHRSLDNFKKIGRNNLTAAKIRNRLNVLKDSWKQSRMVHLEILQKISVGERVLLPYFKDNLFEQAEDAYQVTSDYMADCLEELEPPVSANQSLLHESTRLTSGCAPSTHRLPTIKLPPFDGTFTSWESFRDRFTSLIIDNVELSDLTRMHYLNSCLNGRALDCIKALAITSASFPVAWQLLTDRFENKRRLIQTHLNAILTAPQVSRESGADLQSLRDKVCASLAALKNLKRSPAELWDDMIVLLVSQRLDAATRKAWHLKFAEDNAIPSFQDLCRFVDQRLRASDIDAVATVAAGASSKVKQSVSSATASLKTVLKCSLCKADHAFSSCSKFLSQTPSQRRDLVKRESRCFNCLSSKHHVAVCQSKYTCRQCKQKHHSLLHEETNVSTKVDEPSVQSQSDQADCAKSRDVTVLSASPMKPLNKAILLATAWIKVAVPSGRSVCVRALLDQGSEMTFISERAAQLLRVKRIKMPISISAVGGVNAGTCRFAAHICISPRTSTSPTVSTTALILPKLTAYSPRRAMYDSALKDLKHLSWADDSPMSSHAIDILIGADIYGEILLRGLHRSRSGSPVAQNTVFGWVISGPVGDQHESPPSNAVSSPVGCHHVISSNQCSYSPTLDNELKRFWEIEEVPQLHVMSPEEKQCEEHFLRTHSRSADGRYTVRLPFVSEPPLQIGDSFTPAQKLLQSLFRRFRQNSELLKEYSDFMAEYENLGHMVEISNSVVNAEQTFLIPHHPVFRPSSVTSRLRVVFNASCATSNGASLNDHLLTGPKLQSELPTMILSWRCFKFVYSADIAKMYRQIRVDSRDSCFQRILWKKHLDDCTRTYELKTVTYGTASAPFLALRVLRQLAHDEGHDLPRASKILLHHMYVDDVLFGSNDPSTIRQERSQLVTLLQRGGFTLRKWSSNSSELLADIDSADHGLACQKALDKSEKLKILGVSWLPFHDCFQINVSIDPVVPRTKRLILSAIAKLFDPLGWVTPATITAKIFLQSLWRLKLDWDSDIPNSLFEKWSKTYSQFTELNQVKILRWTHQDSDSRNIELHGFADASSVAYAAVVYMKVTSATGHIHVSLLVGKSRVAPVNPLTIPRLELCAAVLLSRLMKFVRHSIQISDSNCFCWTDSTIVLSWLHHHPSSWKTFVANRVATIHLNVPKTSWRHVPSNDNPADCASRGLPSRDLVSFSLWWEGPKWLTNGSSTWPQLIEPVPAAICELKSVHIHVSNPPPLWDLAHRFSSWLKLVRVTAYLFKFISNCRSARSTHYATDSLKSNLSASDCHKAEVLWLMAIQRDLFPKETAALSNNLNVSAKSSLVALNPFLDTNGILRVGGRLSNSPLPFNTKHPIILASHSLVTLLVRHTHVQTLHAGLALTLATLRQKFWILRGRSLVKLVIHKCVSCARQRALTPTQLMGNLPALRVSKPTRSFIHCGLDYAGPVVVRASGGRGIATRKAYIALFVCLATRAIHLELVSNYSTAAFLDAYSRFCARRGSPAEIFSDNGTTFTGADRELNEMFHKVMNDSKLQNVIATDAVTWHFIPPSAPHFGGLWEAGVKSVKHHLRRVSADYCLTFEEFSTLLCRIEACLNSRPLCPLTDNADDLTVLTPGHFLIGAPLSLTPEPTTLNLAENRLSRWQLGRHLSERFWHLWQTDYLNTLQQRSKWRTRQFNLKVGAIVLLRRPDLPPCKWELGRIVRTHPGTDGLIRVVTVRTAASEYKRPITKICPLPVDVEDCVPERTPDQEDSAHHA